MLIQDNIILRIKAKKNIFVKMFEKLEKTHKGKFHEMSSLKKAVLTDMFQELIDSRIIVSPIIISGKWYEIDTPQDLEMVKKKN